jgi:hypothetical protein
VLALLLHGMDGGAVTEAILPDLRLRLGQGLRVGYGDSRAEAYI